MSLERGMVSDLMRRLAAQTEEAHFHATTHQTESETSLSLPTCEEQAVDHKEVVFTEREVRIMLLAIEGMASQEIAAALSLSKRTIDHYFASIYAKLGVHNRLSAYRRAVELGLLTDSNPPQATMDSSCG